MIENTSSMVRYEGNGSSKTFAFAFRIDDETHLVLKKRVLDVESDITTNFTVTGIGEDAGGTVTYPVTGDALAAEEFLVIARVVPITQATDLENQGGFFPATLEDALDKLTEVMQQHEEQLGRCPKPDITSGLTGNDWWDEMLEYRDEAEGFASAAQASSETATTQANIATGAAGTATTQAGIATAQANAAAASAITAASEAAAAAVSAGDAESARDEIFDSGLLYGASLSAEAGKTLKVKSDGTGYEYADFIEPVASETAGKTLGTTDKIVFFNSATPITVDLGVEATSGNRKHTIVNTGAGTITVASATLNTTVKEGNSITVVCNGVLWRII